MVYHAAWYPLHAEGPNDPNDAHWHLHAAGLAPPPRVPPNDNVWGDVATQWRQLLTKPDEVAHALGKLCSRVGEQRVRRGTDAIWYGSPEAQIMAMRSFEITAEFQDRYRDPALTETVKAGLFGPTLQALRRRPDRHPARPGDRFVDREHPGGCRAAHRGRIALALAAARPDDPAPGAGLARLAAHQLGPVVSGRRRLPLGRRVRQWWATRDLRVKTPAWV